MARFPWAALLKALTRRRNQSNVLDSASRASAGVSYAAQAGNLFSEGQAVIPFETSGGYKDFWEFGANYTGEFAGFSVAVGANGSTATGQPTATAGRTLEDFFAWQAGAQVGYAGFKVGGGYIDSGDYNNVSGIAGVPGTLPLGMLALATQLVRSRSA